MSNQRVWVSLLAGWLTSFAPISSPDANSHVSFSTPRSPFLAAARPAAGRTASTAVRATIYYPTGSPMANGRRIPHAYNLRDRSYRFVAVSRDLLGRYPLGDTLHVAGDSTDRYWDRSLNGQYIVTDIMGATARTTCKHVPRHKRGHRRKQEHQIDILSRPGHERDIGLWKAHITNLSCRK